MTATSVAEATARPRAASHAREARVVVDLAVADHHDPAPGVDHRLAGRPEAADREPRRSEDRRGRRRGGPSRRVRGGRARRPSRWTARLARAVSSRPSGSRDAADPHISGPVGGGTRAPHQPGRTSTTGAPRRPAMSSSRPARGSWSAGTRARSGAPATASGRPAGRAPPASWLALQAVADVVAGQPPRPSLGDVGHRAAQVEGQADGEALETRDDGRRAATGRSPAPARAPSSPPRTARPCRSRPTGTGPRGARTPPGPAGHRRAARTAKAPTATPSSGHDEHAHDGLQPAGTRCSRSRAGSARRPGSRRLSDSAPAAAALRSATPSVPRRTSRAARLSRSGERVIEQASSQSRERDDRPGGCSRAASTASWRRRATTTTAHTIKKRSARVQRRAAPPGRHHGLGQEHAPRDRTRAAGSARSSTRARSAERPVSGSGVRSPRPGA